MSTVPSRRRRARNPSGRAYFGEAHFAELLEPRTLLSVQPTAPEFRVNTTTPGTQLTSNSLSVASNAAGDLMVVWQSVFPADTVYGQRYDAAGAKRGAEFQV